MPAGTRTHPRGFEFCVEWGKVMHAGLPPGRRGAIQTGLGCGSEIATHRAGRAIALGSETENEEWFYEAACSLLGKDAGQQLHYITGYPRSSCYAYVAEDPEQRRRPPEHFLRKLFWKPQGGPFLRAFMHGCTAEHWRALERAERITAQIDHINFE